MRDAGDTSPSTAVPYLRLEDALKAFAEATETQSQSHIRPLHKHVALRLVIEGGFLPEDVSPRPPLAAEKVGKSWVLVLSPEAETSAEQTVVGGLKSKIVDVVVSKRGLGPVVAVSVKGTMGAFRNLTNRMEEAAGDCTNLHMMYPGLVYGFLSILKGHRPGDPGVQPNDLCLDDRGQVVPAVKRYHDVLVTLAGRRLVTNQQARYEAIALAVVEPSGPQAGKVRDGWPPEQSLLSLGRFLPTIYGAYDLRYPYVAAQLASARRVEWAQTSPAFEAIAQGVEADLSVALGYDPRMA